MILQKRNSSSEHGAFPTKSYLLLLLSAIVTICVALFIYQKIYQVLKLSLQSRVVAIVQTASLQFNISELDAIHGPESIDTDNYRGIVFKMQALKQKNPTLRFIDIYRKTNEREVFEYVADSNSIRPDIIVDDNGDGKIDEMDAPIFPGDLYEASSISFIENAFFRTDVAEDLEESQWGFTLDASTPIFDVNGSAEYVINVSVDVSEFVRQSHLAFVPFAIFVFILILILSLITISLVKIWQTRVSFLSDLDRQKDELLGIVAHQLAKPITAIRWDLESLKDGDLGQLNEKQSEEVGLLKSQAANLADLTSMILDVSRIQLGKIYIDPKPLDLQVLFTEMLDVIKPQIVEKKIAFTKHMPKILPIVLLDRRYTRMTIENMLTNAVKYTPEGGKVTLDVMVEKGVMKVTVADTGCGIPKAEQEKIFGKMYRASNVRNTVDGNGFGLYVAKGAIEAQGGKMWFTSEEGQGTTFFVELPIKEA